MRSIKIETLNIDCAGIHISLEVRNRVAIISGDSGTGKSYLVKRIRDAQKITRTNCNATIIDSLVLYEQCRHCITDFVIFDCIEQFGLEKDGIIDYMKQNPDKNYIIFSRGGFILPCGIENIANLEVRMKDNIFTASLTYQIG